MRPALLAHADPCPPRVRPPRPLTLRALAIAVGLSQSAPALAQGPATTSDTSISFALSWSEVNGNTNGVLEPGESAAISMEVSFTNQFGIARISPAPGTFVSGTILGLGTGFLDINGTGGAHGAFNIGFPTPPNGPLNNGTSGYGVRDGWRLVGNASHGSVNAAGTGLTQIQFGQFPWSPAQASTTNPINRMYAFLWTPASYSARTVSFSAAGYPGGGSSFAAIYLDLDHTIGASIYVNPANLFVGRVSIPIVPAPASLAVLALAAFAPRRRKDSP